MNLPPVTKRAYAAMQNLHVSALANCSQQEIRPFLPSLVRMSLLSQLDNTKASKEIRKQILSILVGIDVVNNLVALLQVDYHELEIDVKQEQQLQQKIGVCQQDSAQFHGLQNGIALGFERADATRKVRVVLSEIFYIQSQLAEQNHTLHSRNNGTESVIKSELFDNEIYLEEISDIICISLAELPSLLNAQDLVKALLYVNNGPAIICWIVANVTDSLEEIISALITTGDEDTLDGKLKLSVLYALSDMNLSHALTFRTLCVESMKMPSLMLKLSLKDSKDLIAFISGLLLGNDQNVRSWFALFLRSSQKRKNDALHLVRDELLTQLKNLVLISHGSRISDDCIVQAIAMLRVYAAIRCVAGIKFNEDELHSIVQLVTIKPPPTTAGIRFVSLGLCILIACPSLISLSSLESKAIEWMLWLIKEEAYFESRSGISASFGEMLLLLATHFHSNQISAIDELVCSTLAMKIPIRSKSTTRMKRIFIQEIFTEQVVTSHAVKVPVTPKLNANIPGYLPVHCIHELLKSRAFSKHKVTIKLWIYNQICNSTTPLHPVMPALIEVYMNSLLTPISSKNALEHTHKPLSEAEIRQVFRNSVVGSHLDPVKKASSADTVEAKENSCIVPYHHSGEDDTGENASITSQLLILYYLLLYEDLRLANMSTIMSSERKVKCYTTEFLSELPITYLLLQAQKNQHEYSGLFHPLLRLLITNFPHLSLVDDWIVADSIYESCCSWKQKRNVQNIQLLEGFNELELCPSKLINVLQSMLKTVPTEIWPLSQVFVENVKKILDTKVPRLVKDLHRKVWLRLNTVLPRRLWISTVNALMPTENVVLRCALTHENILMDPLQVLRCDDRVFRCPDALVIVLRILQGSLAASKSQLTRVVQEKPYLEKNGQMQNESDREEIKTAIFALQASTVVQILLEACQATVIDREILGGETALREVGGIVCSYIHQNFISEPSLAKLVHLQTYPRELMSMTVRGIPSMHICLDFLPEILVNAEMDKQIFAIDFTSHLSLQYSLSRSLSVAKLCLNTLSTLLGLLSADARIEMFRATLPCLERYGEAFPPLLEDCVSFPMQLGRVASSQAALGRSAVSMHILALMPGSKAKAKSRRIQNSSKLVEELRVTFSQLLDDAVFNPKIF